MNSKFQITASPPTNQRHVPTCSHNPRKEGVLGFAQPTGFRVTQLMVRKAGPSLNLSSALRSPNS
jgi:hypothetical protein